MKWLLIILIAIGPQYEMAYQEKAYTSEQKCKEALERVMAAVEAREGQIIIGKCEPRPYNGGKAAK